MDEWVYLLGFVKFQPFDLARDLSLFVVGVLASRHNWLMRMPAKTGRAWLGLGLALAAAWYAFRLAAPGGVSIPDEVMGGIFTLWESYLCVAMCIGLAVLFRDLWSGQGSLMKKAAQGQYATYVFHVGVVLLSQWALIGLARPAVRQVRPGLPAVRARCLPRRLLGRQAAQAVSGGRSRRRSQQAAVERCLPAADGTSCPTPNDAAAGWQDSGCSPNLPSGRDFPFQQFPMYFPRQALYNRCTSCIRPGAIPSAGWWKEDVDMRRSYPLPLLLAALIALVVASLSAAAPAAAQPSQTHPVWTPLPTAAWRPMQAGSSRLRPPPQHTARPKPGRAPAVSGWASRAAMTSTPTHLLARSSRSHPMPAASRCASTGIRSLKKGRRPPRPRIPGPAAPGHWRHRPRRACRGRPPVRRGV